MASNPIQSLTSVSTFPVVGSFSFVIPEGNLIEFMEGYYDEE